jgi:hypothetical protein
MFRQKRPNIAGSCALFDVLWHFARHCTRICMQKTALRATNTWEMRDEGREVANPARSSPARLP